MHLKKLLFMLLAIFPVVFYANNTQQISLNKYYSATCVNYTGTWQGFFSDPSDLFGNGGPWPITVSLYNHGEYIVGRTDAKQAPAYVVKAATSQIWAQCVNGQLQHILFENQHKCGDYSETGLLISKNVLVLQLHVENAMAGTNFLLFLQRKNNNYLYKVPTKFVAPNVKSCH